MMTPEELTDATTRIRNPAKGVSFTPRKKPRFSMDSTWDYAETDVLPSIPEVPVSPGGLHDHIVQNWSAMLRTVEAMKSNMSKQKRYEFKIYRLSSEDLDGLHSVASHLLSLVGQPSDGTRFYLAQRVYSHEMVSPALDSPEVAMAFDVPAPIIQACLGAELDLVVRHPSLSWPMREC
jgi:hypothetical protein